MTTDLVTWLRQQLDEDERAVIAYRDGHPGQPCVNYEGQDPAQYDEYDSCARHIAVAEATPYRDVEFGLREVDAKRRIVELHQPYGQKQVMARGEIWACSECGSVDDSPTEWPCDTILLLALPYADRPGYREEWRP